MVNNEFKSIEFVFENCESIEIPFECFTKFDLKDIHPTNDEIITFDSFKCLIEDKGNIKYTSGGFNNKTPVQRLYYNNDITRIYIKFSDDTTYQLVCPWYDYFSNNNQFQFSDLKSDNTIELNIINNYFESNSKWFTLNDVLDTFENETKVKDQDENIYTVCYDKINEVTYLYDTIVNNKILNSKFQKVS